MRGHTVPHFSAVRLRRHGLRPLCFEGALLIQAGDPGGPQIRLYEIADGAFALAIELPDQYTDAWRLETLDEVAEFVGGFNPVQRIGFDISSSLDESADAETAAQALEHEAATIEPAFWRIVASLLRVSPTAA